MNEMFRISFKYPFKEKDFSIELTGNVKLHHSTPYCVVSNIRFAKHPELKLDALPEVRVQQRIIHGEKVWVHMDTQKESELSRLIGQAIEEQSGQKPASVKE
jgi:hypothetical protein